jgi:putative NAD(P)H nitroreductase
MSHHSEVENSLETVVRARRSANNFDESVQISRAELEQLFQLTKLAPSAYNLQHTHYAVVDDKALKQQLKEAAYNQYKVGTSSAAIVVFGDKHAYKQAPQIYEGLLNLGVMSKQEYDQLIAAINSAYEGGGEIYQQEEAIRNASLSAMLFMLLAKDKGWDTCPMIGFDPAAVAKTLNAPNHLVPVLMITIGKEKTSNQRPRGYRKPVAQFVSYGKFQA